MNLALLLIQSAAVVSPQNPPVDLLQVWLKRSESAERLFSDVPLTKWPPLKSEEGVHGWETVARRLIMASSNYAENALAVSQAEFSTRFGRILVLRDAIRNGDEYLNVLTGTALTRIGCAMLLKSAQHQGFGDNALDEALLKLREKLPDVRTLGEVVESELGLVLSFDGGNQDGARHLRTIMQGVLRHPIEVKRVEQFKGVANLIDQALHSRSVSILLTACNLTDYQVTIGAPIVLHCLRENGRVDQDGVLHVINGPQLPGYPIGSWLHRPRPGDAGLSVPQFWTSVQSCGIPELAWTNIEGSK